MFVGVSDECGDLLRRLFPHRASDIVVRPYGIEVPKTLERDYAPEGQPIRLLYAGRIQQDQKRIFDYLTLATELIRRGINFRLRIVGEGDDKVRFIAKREEMGSEVKSRVVVEEGVAPEKMPQLYTENDFLQNTRLLTCSS